jgi:hypothetical protein
MERLCKPLLLQFASHKYVIDLIDVAVDIGVANNYFLLDYPPHNSEPAPTYVYKKMKYVRCKFPNPLVHSSRVVPFIQV